MSKLWLDDVREPPNDYWDVVRNFNQFKNYIDNNGVPRDISFDHDLGGEENGYHCALYIVQNDLPIYDFRVHSSNPVGAKNIFDLLHSYREHKKNER